VLEQFAAQLHDVAVGARLYDNHCACEVADQRVAVLAA
jgi:hypothetical protein